MHESPFQYVLELSRDEGGEPLGQFPVSVDWEPALEHLRMQGLRRCKPGGRGSVSIAPIWADEGEPRAIGARLRDGELASDVTTSYFKPLATELSSDLVEKKVLKSGELFRFKVFAYRTTPAPSETGPQFTVRDATPPLPFVDSALEGLRRASVASDDPEDDEVPVFIPQGVLDEAEELTREAGSNETGGILIGHMHRDATMPEIAVVITAQIPARFTESKPTKLTFTAETWTAVRAALDLRRSGELMLGWWHSHPSFAFCNAECPAERRRECALQKPFLSGDDVLLHRAVFPRGNHVALLANNADAGLGFALFGWRGGTVQRRGFRVLDARRDRTAAAPTLSTTTQTEDQAHAAQPH
jgi:hypothetical protein